MPTLLGLCGCRPSTSGKSDRLAALLLEAPQCVPFEQRVDVFRFLVDADKAQ